MAKQQRVKHICGDVQEVYLVSTSLSARQETLSILARSFCPICQRKLRTDEAARLARQVGLPPLEDAEPAQIELAEQIRAIAWHTLLPPEADHQAVELLSQLFHRQRHALFWLSRRTMVWNRRHLALVLLDLLSCEPQ